MGFLLVWSQAVSASGVIRIDWQVSHETEVAEMKVFLAFSIVWRAAPSFLMDSLQTNKTLLTRWSEIMFFLGKIAEWISRCQISRCWANLPREIGLKQSTRLLRAFSWAALSGSFFQNCTLQESSVTKTSSNHKQGKKGLSDFGGLDLWEVSKIFYFSLVWFKTLIIEKILKCSLRCLTLPMVLINLNFIFS